MGIYDYLLEDDEQKKKNQEIVKSGRYDYLLDGVTPSKKAAEEQKPNILQRIKEAAYNFPATLERGLWGGRKEDNVDETKQENGLLNEVQGYRAETADRVKYLEALTISKGAPSLGQNQSARNFFNKDFYGKQALALDEAKKAYEKDTGLKAEDSLLYRGLIEGNKTSVEAVKENNPQVQLERERAALDIYDQYLENTVSDRGFIKAFLQTVTNPADVAPFIKDVVSTDEFVSRLEIGKKYGRGEKLNTDEQALFNKMRAETLKSYIKVGVGDKAGEVAGSMPKYAIEFVLTGGLYALGRGVGLKVLGKTGQTILEKEALKVGGKEFVKFTMKENAGRIATSLIGSAVQTSGFIPTISSKTAEYMLPEYDLVMASETQAAMKKMDEGDSFGKALAKAGATTYVELATERAGTIVEGATAMIKGAIVGKYMQKMAIKNASLFAKIAGKIGWNGIIGEVFEEELAEVFQAPIEGREYKSLLTPEGQERFLVEVLGIGAFGGIGKITSSTISRIDNRKVIGDSIDISDLPAELEASKAPVEAKPTATEYVEDKGVKFRDGQTMELNPEKRVLLATEMKDLLRVQDKTSEQDARVKEINSLLTNGQPSDISNVKELLLKPSRTPMEQQQVDFFTEKYEGTPEWTEMLVAVKSTSAELSKTQTTTPADITNSAKEAVAEGMTEDEWMKGQGTTVFRGDYTRKQELNNSISTSLDRDVAKGFSESGKISEMVVAKNAKIVDISILRKEILGVDKFPDPSTLTKEQFDSITGDKLIEYAKRKGYDVIDLSKVGIKSSGVKVGKVLDEQEYQIINKDILKTTAELHAEYQAAKTPIKETVVSTPTVKPSQPVSKPEVKVIREVVKLNPMPEGVDQASIQVRPDGTGSFNIQVAEGVRGQGIGVSTVIQLENLLLDKGVTEVKLPVKEESVGFFEKQGYTVVGEQERGLVNMKKTLEGKISLSKEVSRLTKLDYEPSRLEKKVMSPSTLGNPSDKWEAQIRYKGFAADKKAFDTKQQAEDFLKTYEFKGLNKSVYEDYKGTQFVPDQAKGTAQVPTPIEPLTDKYYVQEFTEDGSTFKEVTQQIVAEKASQIFTQEKTQKVVQETELPKVKQPVGKGDVKVSRFAERLQEQLLESDPSRYEFDDNTAKYNTLNLENDAKKAVNFLQKNPQESLSIALGLLDAPIGQTTNAIGIATMLKAEEESNFKLYAELMNSLSLRNTRLGQEIVTLRGRFDADSTENFVKQVINTRMEKLGRSLLVPWEKISRKVTSKEAVIRKVREETVKAKQAVSLEQTKVSLAQDIIDSLRC